MSAGQIACCIAKSSLAVTYLRQQDPWVAQRRQTQTPICGPRSSPTLGLAASLQVYLLRVPHFVLTMKVMWHSMAATSPRVTSYWVLHLQPRLPLITWWHCWTKLLRTLRAHKPHSPNGGGAKTPSPPSSVSGNSPCVCALRRA